MMTHESSLSFELVKLEKAYAEFERRVKTDHTQKVTRMVRNFRGRSKRDKSHF